MKRIILSVIFLTMLLTPVAAVDFGPNKHIDNETGATVRVTISADTPFVTPYTEEIEIDLSIEFNQTDITQLNISEIAVSIQKYQPNLDSYTPIGFGINAYEPEIFSTYFGNITDTIELSESISAVECYFAITLVGSFTNGSDVHSFEIMTSNDFLGPFTISPGSGTAEFIVGAVLILITVIVMVAGAYVVKKSKEPVRKRASIED
ncbi:MAG: hypothetical protein GF411_19405 [Candidatus Lokiarchaeota archaeon]|nr:hypothetical protein [Candidatus Lokiarchaeota archaeon]